MLKKGGYELDTSGPSQPPAAWRPKPLTEARARQFGANTISCALRFTPKENWKWDTVVTALKILKRDGFDEEGLTEIDHLLTSEGFYLIPIECGEALACTCPTECDCQQPEPIDGVALKSNLCPVHNLHPMPDLNCPVHGEKTNG